MVDLATFEASFPISVSGDPRVVSAKEPSNSPKDSAETSEIVAGCESMEIWEWNLVLTRSQRVARNVTQCFLKVVTELSSRLFCGLMAQESANLLNLPDTPEPATVKSIVRRTPGAIARWTKVISPSSSTWSVSSSTRTVS